MSVSRRSGAGVLVGVALALAAPARAQEQSAMCATRPAGRSWQPPLDRAVTLQASALTLRDALDRLSGTTGVRLSYASELLTLDRSVCVRAAGDRLGDVLLALVRGDGVEPVVVGAQVVLTPSRAAAAEEVPTARGIGVLDRVVVTGTAAGASRRPLPVAIDVMAGHDLEKRNVSSLATALDGSVPGVWMWERSSSSLLAQYGGVRGASSFGATYPKVYLDGIEVANPLLLTRIDPDVIDRVEIIRGPQGAALYGADAISGVMNIVTRHEGSGEAPARGSVRTEEGVVQSAYASGTVGTHTQRASLRTGSNLRSAGIGATFSQTGEFIPSAQSRQLAVLADGRMLGSSGSLSGTARFYDVRAGVGQSPLLAAALAPRYRSDSAAVQEAAEPQTLREYTLGSTAVLGAGGRWTHTIIAGIDGYHLDHAADATSPFPSSVDSALQSARGSGDRASLRASSVTRLGSQDARVNGTVTLGVEHSVLRQRTDETETSQLAAPTQKYPLPAATRSVVEIWRHDTGLLAQASAAFDDSFFLSGGLRIERNDAFSTGSRYPVLPMVGAAWVRNLGDAELKLRAAYGKGIRPPQTPALDHSRIAVRTMATQNGLDPEVQRGVEAGAELHFGSLFSLQVTRFDQHATGLLQNVVTYVDTLPRMGAPQRRVQYTLQNVGAIRNRGWELGATATLGQLALSSAFAQVNSRVEAIALRYLGDLKVGDRMLEVPARTASLSGVWSAPRWTAALGATRAFDWTDYDRLALGQAFLSSPAAAHQLVGVRLRQYWRHYDGATTLRASTSVEVRRGISIVTTGENLLGGQLGEPDNLTVRPGRTITAGVRAGF